jgi:hypothetical protein
MQNVLSRPASSKQNHFHDFLRRALKNQQLEPPFDPKSGNTHYRSPMWSVARAVKGQLPDWSAERAWKRVNHVVEQHLGGWERWNIEGFFKGESNADGSLDHLTVEDIQTDFIQSFDLCVMPGATDPLAAAARFGDARPFPLKNDRGSPGYRRFISMCAFVTEVTRRVEHGGGIRGDHSFFLPCRKTGSVLGVRKNTVSVWIKWAKQDGLLKQVKPHCYRSRKAAEFELVGEDLCWWHFRCS